MSTATRRTRTGPTSRDKVTDFYDTVMYSKVAEEFNGGTSFQNYGYWTAATEDYPEAASNLMNNLLDLAPATGEILDVACGQGATTRFLGEVFGARHVTGINISEKQLATARDLASGSDLAVMDATHLDYNDETFDLVVCVEAAFHFDTRQDFFDEALRVLHPGGYLILSDILFKMPPPLPYPGTDANRIVDPRAYEDLLLDTGFDDVAVVDATEECFAGFLRAFRHFVRRGLVTGSLAPALAAHLTRRLRVREAVTSYYVLAGARRPLIEGDSQ